MFIILKKFPKNIFHLAFFSLVLLLFACKNERANQHNANSESVSSPNISAKASETSAFANDFISSAATNIEKADSAKRFIKTADLRFRVKNALKSSMAIEDIALRNKGFVTKSNLVSNEQSTQSIYIGNDSLREIKTFVVENSIELRVPFKQLDTTIRAIAQQIDYLEYRKIEAEDVTFKLLDKILQESRSKNYIQHAFDKLNPTTKREDRILEEQGNADEAFVEKMRTEDGIRYSTIRLSIYQAPTTHFYTIANTNKTYHTPFWLGCKNALIESWDVVEALLIFLVKIFMPCLLLLGVYIGGRFIWKKYIRNDLKKTRNEV